MKEINSDIRISYTTQGKTKKEEEDKYHNNSVVVIVDCLCSSCPYLKNCKLSLIIYADLTA